jgi:hypothetical protein
MPSWRVDRRAKTFIKPWLMNYKVELAARFCLFLGALILRMSDKPAAVLGFPAGLLYILVAVRLAFVI